MNSARTIAERWVLLGLVAGVTALFASMLLGLLMPIFFAVVLAILFRPVFVRIERAMPGYASVASGLTLLVAVLFVALPAFGVGKLLVSEAFDVYRTVSDDPGRVLENAVAAVPPELLAAQDLSREELRGRIVENVQAIAASVFSVAASATTGTLGFMLKAAITFYLMFFFLKDGPRFLDIVARYFPLPDAQEHALFERFASTVRAVVKGGIIVAMAQGAAGGILLWMLGLPHAALWGAVMAFLALIPFAGPAIVWVPAAMFLFLAGDITSAAILVIGGSLLIGTIDNILRPYLVGRDTSMPDALIFLSVFGGLSTFGAGGIIMGPVVAALFLSVWQLFGEQRA